MLNQIPEPWLAVFGRLHIVLLHVPIGLFAGVFVLELSGLVRRAGPPRGAILGLCWLLVLCNAAAIASGLQLAQEESEVTETLELHRNLGIAFGIASLILALAAFSPRRALFRLVLLAGAALLVPAGHIGGGLVHGANFLTKPLQQVATPTSTQAPLANQPVEAYAHVIAPILGRYCTRCHGTDKQKGELTLHTREGIEKGGENGAVLVAGKPADSPMLTQCELPDDDDLHMPPPEKPQPSDTELAALRRWIEAGAPFSGPIEGLSPIAAPAGFKPDTAGDSDDPDPKAVAEAAAALNLRRASAEPLADVKDHYRVDFTGIAAETDDAVIAELLKPMAPRIGELSLARTRATDASVALCAAMPRLRRLDLRDCPIEGSTLAQLEQCRELSELVLAGTKIGDPALPTLLRLPALRTVYLWQSRFTPAAAQLLRSARPELTVDTGEAAPAPVIEVDDPNDPFAAVRFLAGTWRGGGGNRVTEEHWSAPLGGVMLGHSRTVSDGKLVEHEILALRVIDGKLTYCAQPDGRPDATQFTLLPGDGKRVTFENPANEFPKRIHYWLAVDGTLHARIDDGTDAGKSREFTWQKQ